MQSLLSKFNTIDDSGLGSVRRRKFPGFFRTPRSGDSIDELPSTDTCIVIELAIFHCSRCGLGNVKVYLSRDNIDFSKPVEYWNAT